MKTLFCKVSELSNSSMFGFVFCIFEAPLLICLVGEGCLEQTPLVYGLFDDFGVRYLWYTSHVCANQVHGSVGQSPSPGF